ncbi:hypothetical protein F8M41_017191 [Gigaspora margarita]|uniref:F-box domain-containing protein n=1 Tax=Gigaspora margarita TaxID=4874 RepID=A0A8H4B2W5_GIGMA|nr:hypothetical protein F8M41_017191 [Gigaspora margarita]
MAIKIFTDMPELLENILYNLSNEIYSLHSGGTLNNLSLNFSDYEINSEILNSLERSEQFFFSQLQNLSLYITSQFRIDNVTTLLRILAKNTTKIRALHLDGFYFGYESQLIHTLIYIIKSQEQLRKFHLFGDRRTFTKPYGTISALEYQKQSLQEIIINKCYDYCAEFDVLTNCENLEVLRIINCDLKILKTTSLYKIKPLKTLEIIDYAIDASCIVEILENSGSLLQRLKLESENRDIYEDLLLLKTLKSFCPNITYLNFLFIEFSPQLIELIGNLKQLQFLTLLCTCNYIPEKELKTRVIQLAEILPLTLQYLDLLIDSLEPHIDIFLNNCNAPLKNLLINHLDIEKNTKALIEFCKRNETLNYVGSRNFSYLDRNIKKEVERYVSLVPFEDIVIDC